MYAGRIRRRSSPAGPARPEVDSYLTRPWRVVRSALTTPAGT
jgi:hypothetical protein